ncbi:ROK family protein [Arvimicrobium flavum]|uniref:ROK family protein n=1 Tax=Arvimicrobium flavum TaxID=3393320 RepID=UPI00237BA95B|nr:ROK family protein [Mesorhizobium shangrilense]
MQTAVRIRHDDLRRRNRAAVIAAVRRAVHPSRTEIAAATGLSHSTISAISSDLLQEGILAEPKATEPSALKRGRPQVAIGLNAEAATVVTVDLSLNSLSAALFDYGGTVLAAEKRRLPTLEMAAADLVHETIGMVRGLFEMQPSRQAAAKRIVVSIQGVTDASARSMLWSPITVHADIPFAEALEEAFGVATTVENDCNMMAFALRSRDPEIYHDDFIAILLSHGIGMGMMLKGELFTGTHSSGGEFGHMIHRPDGALCRCGRRGCIEAYAGNYAIWRKAHHQPEDEMPKADVTDADITELAEQARRADGSEREAFRRAGEALGFGLGSLFAIIDPAPVAFIGVGATAFDLMEPSLREAIAKTAGGQHSGSITFLTEPYEAPIIREGSAKRALQFVDEGIFAPGALPAGKAVA